jgi:23S rRNA pseudouridine1911/1915/1917 synthase
MELKVLHSDEALIVVDKPSGIVIHPGSGQASGTLVNGLLERFPELAVVGRAERPGIVHRLDRETTGVIVVARTNEAAKSLVNQFKRKSVEKEYTAVVWGEMPFDNDWIDLALGPDPRRPQQRAVVEPDAPGAQAASTFYTVEERLGRASLVTARPRTGRTHQIRAHLAHLGFPVVADPLYGRRAQSGWQQWKASRRERGLPEPVLERHALHARRITLQHPASGETVSYEAPLPADMRELLEMLREEAGG